MTHGCAHAADAARCRYGVALDDADFAAMAHDIVLSVSGESNAAVRLSAQAGGREVWMLRIPHGPAVRVVWLPEIARIVTVLPPRWRLPRPEGAA